MNKKLKLIIRDILKIIIILAVFWLLGATLMAMVFSLPTKPMKNHLKESVYIFQKEDKYPKVLGYRLDNFTDSIELLEAVYDNKDSSTIEKAMYVYSPRIASGNPVETIINHYNDGEEFAYTGDYARYWHGYLVFLKPLLMFINFNELRIVNCMIQTFLLMLVIMLMSKGGIRNIDVTYLLTVMAINPIACAMSLQFSSCYYVMLIGTILILFIRNNDKQQYAKWIFFFVGICTAYFDLLTYPILPLGVLLIIWIKGQKSVDYKYMLKNTIGNAVFWGVGYAGMWSGKWILGSLLVKQNLIAEAVSSVSLRMGNNNTVTNEVYTFTGTVSKNVKEFVNYNLFEAAVVLFVVYFISASIYKLVKKKRVKEHRKQPVVSILMILIAIAPFVWFMITRNHSSIHYWMTNKELLITFYSVMSILQNLSD